jgi:hypothetical protein
VGYCFIDILDGSYGKWPLSASKTCGLKKNRGSGTSTAPDPWVSWEDEYAYPPPDRDTLPHSGEIAIKSMSQNRGPSPDGPIPGAVPELLPHRGAVPAPRPGVSV